ncbi:MAG TPA: hypothetical protein PKN47_19250 [Nitrospira sp.]|nr:hypothetical protein [Nitrospira sp.]
MRFFKKVIFVSISIIVGFVVPLLSFEFLLRFMPVVGNIEYSVVTESSPYIHHLPHSVLSTSLGWNFYRVITNQSNNYGYISSADYSKSGRPTLAVIGDSFVEALQVEKGRSLTAGLTNSAIGNIYNIAISGSALSQYVAFAKFAESEFDPKAFVIVVVGNDFDESLCAVRPKPGHHCYERQNGDLKLILKESHSVGGIRRVAKQSALMRYLVFNLKVDWRRLVSTANLLSNEVADARYAGNTEFAKSIWVEQEARAVVDQFFEDLGMIIGSKPLLFIVDADREAIYKGSGGDNSFFSKIRNYFIAQAHDHNHEVIDMYPIFLHHYATHKIKFEFPTDGHWNELGHKLAAEAVGRSNTVQQLILSEGSVRSRGL